MFRGVNVSMEISYRRLKEQDLAIFIAMRISQLREEGANEQIDLEPALNVDCVR